MVIALARTPEGLPPAYEVLSGNTAYKTTLRDFSDRIEDLRLAQGREMLGGDHRDGAMHLVNDPDGNLIMIVW